MMDQARFGFEHRMARRLGTLAVMCLMLVVAIWAPERASAHDAMRCRSMNVAVSLPSMPNASLYGELCVPGMGRPPTTVQLLVHSGNTNHYYWDFPYEPNRYSYVRKAVAAGYATFNVDRLGYGSSTHPLSSEVTLENGAEALHDVITQLRNGSLGTRFTKVVWNGELLGAVYGWVEAARYHDVDAFVFDALVHHFKPSSLPIFKGLNHPAIEDPKFAGSGLDTGYGTSIPGKREILYYMPNVDPNVYATDEQLKDTTANIEFAEGLPLFADPPPATALSRSIHVPTLLVVGDHHVLSCGPPDGIECTATGVMEHEAPYYSPDAHLQVMIVPESDLFIQLQRNAPQTDARTLAWISQAVGWCR